MGSGASYARGRATATARTAFSPSLLLTETSSLFNSDSDETQQGHRRRATTSKNLSSSTSFIYFKKQVKENKKTEPNKKNNKGDVGRKRLLRCQG
ncbi:hypothetical protein ES288_D12G140000v1 [Gossypium darwinii]|uniref:Uncharacterized protein n=1 Tax=Gossypium darwinii TaxID=34276 RepID=A0A5D2A9C6_GOSDA|nr:hypothetical protein ES288_D12G140000v1 [Gossypium darwinii]